MAGEADRGWGINSFLASMPPTGWSHTAWGQVHFRKPVSPASWAEPSSCYVEWKKGCAWAQGLSIWFSALIPQQSLPRPVLLLWGLELRGWHEVGIFLFIQMVPFMSVTLQPNTEHDAGEEVLSEYLLNKWLNKAWVEGFFHLWYSPFLFFKWEVQNTFIKQTL